MSIFKVRTVFVIALLIAFFEGGVVMGAEDGKENLSGVPFSPGEKLTFRVMYLAFPAGTIVLEVEEMISWEGHEVYRLVATARSSPLFSLFFRVRNRVESLLDTGTFLPHRFEGHREEGGFRSQRVISFDRDRNLALTFDTEEKETEPQGISTPVPPEVQDALSALYYLRRRNLKVGESFFIDVNMGRRNYQIEVDVLRRERRGREGLETIVVRPLLKRVEMGGIMEDRGDIYIWLTDDERRLPVLIKARVAIGSLTMMLVDKELGE